MVLSSENIMLTFIHYKWVIEDFNIIGIRSNLQVPDSFNDMIGCFYKVLDLPNTNLLEIQKIINLFQFDGKPIREDGLNGKETTKAIELYQSKIGSYQYFLAQGTTIPSIYWLNNTKNKLGTAVLEGDKQYLKIWKRGLHKNQDNHPAFVQVNEIEVLRDFNHNDIAGDSNIKETGLFGINCHRANTNGKTLKIGLWSAGCQVFDEKRNLERLLNISSFYNPKNDFFNYSLINEKSIQTKI